MAMAEQVMLDVASSHSRDGALDDRLPTWSLIIATAALVWYLIVLVVSAVGSVQLYSALPSL